MDEMVKVTAGGVDSLMGIAPLVTVLVLIIIVCVFFIWALLKDAREERALNREALKGNTIILTEFKEMIRGALNR